MIGSGTLFFTFLTLPTDFVFIDRWYSYNTIKGEPRGNGIPVSPVKSSEIIWSYDNTKNAEPFKDEVSEMWKETSSATLSVTVKGMIVPFTTRSHEPDEFDEAGIELKQSIQIPEVGGSEFSISISTEATNSESKQNEHSLTNKWSITFVLYLSCYLHNFLIPCP